MMTDPSAAYDAARKALAQAEGFRFEISFESTPTRAYEATGVVSRQDLLAFLAKTAG